MIFINVYWCNLWFYFVHLFPLREKRVRIAVATEGRVLAWRLWLWCLLLGTSQCNADDATSMRKQIGNVCSRRKSSWWLFEPAWLRVSRPSGAQTVPFMQMTSTPWWPPYGAKPKIVISFFMSKTTEECVCICFHYFHFSGYIADCWPCFSAYKQYEYCGIVTVIVNPSN